MAPRSDERERSRDRLAERLLDVDEVAAMLAVKPATLYQWAYQRRKPVASKAAPAAWSPCTSLWTAVR
jgi:hypothetical protein